MVPADLHVEVLHAVRAHDAVACAVALAFVVFTAINNNFRIRRQQTIVLHRAEIEG